MEAAAIERTEPLRIVRIAAFHGANWFAEEPVAVAFLAGGFPGTRWKAAVGLLGRLLPTGLPAGLPEAPGTAAAAVEAIALAIRAWAGFRTSPPRRLAGGAEQSHCAAVPLGGTELTEGSLTLAVSLLAAVSEDDDTEAWLEGARPRLQAMRAGADRWLPSSRRHIADAADDRRLPWRSIMGPGVLVQVGEGRRSRLFDGGVTNATPHLGLRSAGNKRIASRMLQRVGVPMARQMAIPDLAAACAAMQRFGLPLVIKPEAARKQEGVGFVYREEELEAVFLTSMETSTELIAESYLPGREYRALMIGGRVASVIRSNPPVVTGDGRSTIAELVAATNSDGRGRRDEGFAIGRILWDDLAIRFLAHHDRHPETVPAAGERVETYPLPIMRFGGERKVDVTDEVHPETRAMLERAVAVFELDVAGIDFRTPDVSRSWREVGAGLCEVNPQPALTIHYNIEPPVLRDVARILLDTCMPRGERWTMTHILIVGGAEMEGVAAAVAAALRSTYGWRVATSTPAGIDLDGWPVAGAAGASLVDRCGIVVEDRTLDAAVHLASGDEITRRGLGLRSLDLGLVPAPTAERRAQMSALLSTLRAAGADLAALPDDDALTPRVALAALRARTRRGG